MITVKYNRAYNKLTVSGHAGAGKMGEDLVCSAASILVHTLSANAGYLQEAGLAEDASSEIREGYACIRCRAAKGCEAIVSRTYQSVCVGFEIMADKFPEYISYKILG